MARYERSTRPAAGAPPGAGGRGVTVKMQLGADGKWHAVEEPRDTVAETEARPRPPHADDPRPSSIRAAPPFGASG